MRVKDVMTRGVVTCRPDDPVREVATRMKEHDVGMVPILENEQVVSLVTDRDLVTRGLADARGPDTPVGELATPKVWTVHEHDSIADLADRMKEKRVRRFVVLDAEERPVGLVALGDLAHHGDAEAAGAVLESISEPATPQRLDPRTKALPAFARAVD